MTDPEEKALLDGARRFDPIALETVYDRFSPRVYRYAVRLLGDALLAEDCVAETFTRLLQAFRGGQGPVEHLQAYLFRIAHNWITDYFRRSPPPTDALDDHPAAESSDRTEDAADSRLRGRQLRAAMRLLTPEQRQVLALRFLEGWSAEEIAHAMERPVGAVRALQQRGIAALRRLLVREEEEP